MARNASAVTLRVIMLILTKSSMSQMQFREWMQYCHVLPQLIILKSSNAEGVRVIISVQKRKIEGFGNYDAHIINHT